MNGKDWGCAIRAANVFAKVSLCVFAYSQQGTHTALKNWNNQMLQVTINLKFALNSNFSFTFLFYNYLLGRNHYLYLNFSHLSKMLLGWLGLGRRVFGLGCRGFNIR